MRRKKLKAAVMLVMVCLFLFSGAMTVVTAAQEASRVTAALSTDKESYVDGDTAAVTLKVTNGYASRLDEVKTKISLPEGLSVQNGSLTESTFSLEAGQSITNEIMATVQENRNGTAVSSPNTGEPGSIVWAMLAALSGIAVLAMALKGKHKKQTLAMFLCLAILLTSVPMPVSAADLSVPSGSVTTEKKVTVNGQERTITATVTYGEKEKNTVTISFQCFGGTIVEPVTIAKGTAPERLPQSYQMGKSFTGWYSDAELTKPFYADTVLTEDLVLYASFVDVDDEMKMAEKQTYYVEDCDASMPITLICEEEITAENINDYMTLYAFTGEVPESFTVTKSGNNEYTIVPDTPYSAGCQYRMTIPVDVRFKGTEDTVNEYTFRIHKEQSKIVDLDDGIKYVEWKEFEETDTKYKFKVSKSYVEKHAFAVEDTLCIGDGTTNYDEDTLFINIVQLEEQGDYYYVYGEDSDIDDVFDDVDVFFTESAENEFLKDGFDPDVLEQSLYDSEGVEQLNYVMAAMLAESPDVTEILGGVPLLAQPDDYTMMDFSDYACLDKDKKFIELRAKLKNMMTITVQIGPAINDNFYNAPDEYWTVLTFKFTWKGTIKNKLDINASFTISEYMNVTLQGYNESEFKLFELPQLEFDYAANMYSQTDIEIKILVCSVDKRQDGYKDISADLTSMFSSDKENDTEGLIAEVQEMLDSKGDYIELCEIPFFSSKTPLALFSLNMDLSFVIKVNFAAGLSTKYSVLDSIQVGARGNSADGSFDMYKNDLREGDRYSFDLSVCGYLGVKMGVRGSLTVSFLGLDRLGKVGVSVEVGVYLDMYGYARYHVVKPYTESKNVYTTLAGGFYMEAGLYLEVKLIAKSDVFKVEASVSLLDEKWPLFTMGKKDVLLTLNDLETPILIESKGTSSGYIELSDAPALTGRTIDITTGDVNEDTVIPWSSVDLRFTDRRFYEENSRIEYRKFHEKYDTDNSAECTAEMYYLGQTMQFTKKGSSDNYTYSTGKVFWYDSTKVRQDAIGKICTANFYLELDGEKTLLGSRQVKAGNGLGVFYNSEIYSPKYTDGKWNIDPADAYINDDTDFIYSVKRAQARVVFIYFDDTSKQWTAEMKVMNVGDIPSIDKKYANDHMKITSWEMVSGGGLDYSSSEELDSNGQMNSYVYGGYTSGWTNYVTELSAMNDRVRDEAILVEQATDKVLCSVSANSAKKAKDLLIQKYGTECAKVAFYYTPTYLKDKVTVTYSMLDYNGERITKSCQIPYGTSFTYSSVTYPYWMAFKGFSSDGGKTVYYNQSEFPQLYEDTFYEGIFEPIMYDVTLQYYDNTTNEFKEYKTYSIRCGEKVPEEYFKEAEAAYKWGNVPPEKNFGWIDIDTGEKATSAIMKDCIMRLDFRRSVRISLEAGDGVLLFDDFTQSFSTENYQLKIGERAAKSSDNYYDYPLTGWKNKETGEIYGVDEVVTIYNPVTLVAVYTPVPKTYHITITTKYGTLKNGETAIDSDVDYDTYTKLIREYSDWRPADYRDDENHCTYVSNGPQVIEGNKSYTINYVSWKKVVDPCTITIDVAGGTYSGLTKIDTVWNAEIDLSTIVASKEDDSAYLKMSYWTDKANNRYATDAKYRVTGNDTLTLHWEVDTYKEYTITFELDGKNIKTEKYHMGDTLGTFASPAEAAGKIFSGWTWYDGENVITKPDTMPAKNLTAKGTATSVYITYKVDGIEISELTTEASIGQQYAVKPDYVKEGYTVGAWSTTDVTVDDNGQFLMPEKNVTFTATSTKNSYTVTYYHNGEAYGTPAQVPFGDYVRLIDVPKESGKYYKWTSEDAVLTDIGFTMPAKDVRIDSAPYTDGKHIIYYVNDVIVGYDTAIPGNTITVKEKPTDSKYNNMTFSGWYTGKTALKEGDTVTVGEDDILIYGYYTSGSTKVNIYFDENNSSPDIVMYGNAGDNISITMQMNDQEIAGYKVNDVVADTITIPNTNPPAEINAYVQYTAKKYKVSYNCYTMDAIASQTAQVGETVYLENLPGEKAGFHSTGWFAADVVIQKDSNDNLYFEMPAHDVVINLQRDKTTTATETKTASVYINSPYSDGPVLFNQYTIDDKTNTMPLYFDVPSIEGYEFVGWKNTDGEFVDGGMTYTAMAGADRDFYGVYRKLELHIIEFKVDDEVVGYRTFYDTYDVKVTPPVAVTSWTNDIIRSIEIRDGNVLFNTGDRKTYEYAKKDYIFIGSNE